MEADKASLREEALKHRARLRFSGRESEEAASHFLRSFVPMPPMRVALYLSMRGEIETAPLILELTKRNIVTLLPKMNPDQTLSFFAWTDGDPVKAAPSGVSEPVPTDGQNPEIPDIVIVPLLAFDRRGMRLGYGGGYYDRTLEKLRREKSDLRAVGYAYAQQAVLFPLPAAPHDQRLDAIVSENGVLHFS